MGLTKQELAAHAKIRLVKRLADPTRARCEVDGCERTWQTSKMCALHYNRWYLGRDVSAPMRIRLPVNGECALKGCNRPAFSKGWCKSHWARVNNTGDPGTVKIRQWGNRICEVDGCERRHVARGCCDRHYAQLPDRKAYDAVKSGNRRLRKRGQSVGWPIDPAKIQARIDYFGGCCWICGGDGADEIDHVKPLVKGGLHTPANMRPAHGDCNRRKAAKWEGVEALWV